MKDGAACIFLRFWEGCRSYTPLSTRTLEPCSSLQLIREAMSMLMAMVARGLLPLSISRADLCFPVELAELKKDCPPPSPMLIVARGVRLIPELGMLIARTEGVWFSSRRSDLWG